MSKVYLKLLNSEGREAFSSVNSMETWIQCTLIKFADYTKLSGAVDTPEGQDVIQRDLEKLNKGAHGNLTRFSKVKCKVLQNSGSIGPIFDPLVTIRLRKTATSLLAA
ncbi:hypothetical protein BTVI_15932 [Pitangus sulphuratus]|nr:hypothetical protein BTVI_15932 [Pitangus sulphuratus]